MRVPVTVSMLWFVLVSIGLPPIHANAEESQATGNAVKPKELQQQIVERLNGLADLLEKESATAERAVTPSIGARSIRSRSGLRSSLESASREGSIIAKDALRSPELTDRTEAEGDEQLSSGIVIGEIVSDSRDFADYAKYLRGLAKQISTGKPENASAQLENAFVPGNVRELLNPPIDVVPRIRARRLSVEEPSGDLLKRFAAGHPRIVGFGSRASTDYPAVASIIDHEGDGVYNPFCTGTLIAPNVVLSAAHCFCELGRVRYNRGDKCKSGTFRLSDANNTVVKALDTEFRRVFFQHGGIHEIEKIEIRDDYVWPTRATPTASTFPENDISLVILKEPVTNIRPSPINNTGPVTGARTGTIVGFGRYSRLDDEGTPITQGAGGSAGLKFTAKINTGTCGSDIADKQMICWTYESQPPTTIFGNTCSGDSGGPLFVRMGSDVIVAGVTSGGQPGNCGPTDFPFDTSVYDQRTWIANTLAKYPLADFTGHPTAALYAHENAAGRYMHQLDWDRLGFMDPSISGQFLIPSGVSSVRLTLNSDRVPANAQLSLKATDEAGTQKCDVSGRDSVQSCGLSRPASGWWSFELKGAPGQELQFVATGF